MTDIELLVLGLLAEQDRYGYQIDEEIKKRNMRRWATIGFSSIYYTLSSLKRRRLLESRVEQSAVGPKRRIFAITDAGRQTLSQEAIARLAECIPSPTSFYLGIALSKHVDRTAVLPALKEHAHRVSERLQEIKRGIHEDTSVIAKDMMELGIALAEAEAEWLNKFTIRMLGNVKSEKGD